MVSLRWRSTINRRTAEMATDVLTATMRSFPLCVCGRTQITMASPSQASFTPCRNWGVYALGLNYKESKRTDQYGNGFRYRAKVYDVHGESVGRWAWDVFFVKQ